MTFFNCKDILSYTFKLWCMVGFLYQTIQLLNDYLMGKTVISLEVKRLEEEPLPAITFCTYNWLSMRKLENSQQFSHIFDNYTKIYQEYNKTFMKYYNKEEDDFKENITVLKELNEIYFNTLYTLKKLRKEIYSSIEKYGINVNDLNSAVNVRGVIGDKVTVLNSYKNMSLNDPVESVINNGNSIYKCFTFNSFLKTL